MTTKVKMLCLTPSGRFRIKTAKITPDFPNHARGAGDHQAHSLEEDPIIRHATPITLDSVDDLLTVKPRRSSRVDDLLAITEENNPWPVSTNLILTAEQLEHRQRKRRDYEEIGVQHARNQNIQDTFERKLMTMGFIVGACVFAFMALIAGLIIIDARFGGEAPPIAAASIALIGAVARGVSRRRPYKETVYLYDTGTHDKIAARVPFNELWDRFGDIPRYVAEVRQAKLVGLLAGIIGGGAAGFGLVWWATAQPIIAIVAALGFAFPGGLIGAIAGGPVWLALNPLTKPFWIMYRQNIGDEDTPYPMLAPFRHTLGHGVDPVIYDEIKDEILREAIEVAKAAGVDELPEYAPTVNTADDLEQNLLGHLEQAEHRLPDKMGDKLQIGSMMVMALASILICVFVAIALAQ